MLKYIFIFSVFSLVSIQCFSQEPLPDFTIKKGTQNQKVISWRNNFGDMIIVLNIQRSGDSVRNFRTVYSETAPSLAVNAFTDMKPVPGMDYYRIYYQMKNGSYYFTKAKKVASGFISEGLYSHLNTQHVTVKGDEDRTVTIADFHRIADSVLLSTSDSLFYFSDSTVNYKKFNAIAAISPGPAISNSLIPVSNYLFLNPDGNLVIRIPDNKAYDYSMVIYQPDGNTVLYKIGRFPGTEIILSKSSFIRAGFYPYELFEDGKLKERSRFQIK